nr:ribonuclease H-like domain-containing protein [Tanacetum cinerariifolium]
MPTTRMDCIHYGSISPFNDKKGHHGGLIRKIDRGDLKASYTTQFKKDYVYIPHLICLKIIRMMIHFIEMRILRWNDADSSEDIFTTHNEKVTTLEDNIIFEGNLDQNLTSKYSHWTDAMYQKMDALLRNGSWEIMDLPKDRKAIESKGIYKIKYRSSGDIDRYEARLVA